MRIIFVKFYRFLEDFIFFFFFNKIFVKRNFESERVIVRWRFFFRFEGNEIFENTEMELHKNDIFMRGILMGISNIE